MACSLAGLEPHSALPVALPMVFTDHCDLLPKGLKGIKILAHTAVSFQISMVGTTLSLVLMAMSIAPQHDPSCLHAAHIACSQ